MMEKVHSWFTDNVHMILGVVNLTMLSFQFLKDFMIQPFFSFTDFHFIPCWRTKITFTDFCEIQDILSEEIASIQGLNSYKYNSLYNPLYLPRNMEELHEIQIVKKKINWFIYPCPYCGDSLEHCNYLMHKNLAFR